LTKKKLFPSDSFGKNGGMPSPKTGSRIFLRKKYDDEDDFNNNLSEMSGMSDDDDDNIRLVKF